MELVNKEEDTKPNNNGNNGNNNNTSTVKAGSKFTYKHTDFDDQTGTTVVSTKQYTLTMLRDTTINNEKWLVVERKDETQAAIGLVRFAEDGMYRYGSNGAKIDFKFKAAVNDTWTDPENQSCKVISINQSVTVPKELLPMPIMWKKVMQTAWKISSGITRKNSC